MLENLTNDHPNLIWDKLEKNFVTMANVICPEREFKIRKDRPTYFTSNVSKQIAKRDRLFREAKLSNDKHKRKCLWSKATKKRQEVKSLLRRAKRDFITSELERHKKDPKKYWRSMNLFQNKGKRNAKIENIILSNGEKVNASMAAEVTNDYFCMVGSKLANNIVPTTRKFTIESVKCKFKWEMLPSEEQVLKKIGDLSDVKSSGIMQLNSKILNPCMKVAVRELTHLLNQCIRRGEFPTKWKQGIVVPIPKGNKIKTLNNIRPITLLPTPGKILEQFMHERIYMYLMENKLLSDKQTGFRKNFGIHDPIIDLVNFIHRCLNVKKQVVCIFVDMAKAFNSLNTTILLDKLHRMGFEGKSFLSY